MILKCQCCDQRVYTVTHRNGVFVTINQNGDWQDTEIIGKDFFYNTDGEMGYNG